MQTWAPTSRALRTKLRLTPPRDDGPATEGLHEDTRKHAVTGEEEQRDAREDVTRGGDGRTEKRQKAQHGCDRQDGIRVTGLFPRLNSKCQISQ